MMDAVPVCECPKCNMLGLHLMPYIATTTESKPGVKLHIEEIPVTVRWYDERLDTGSKPMIRTTHEYTLVTVEIDMLGRECAFCRYEWFQEIRRRTVE
jgi:hypothetical protein